MISEGVRFHQIASDQGRHWLSLIQQLYTHSHVVKWTCFREEIKKNKENKPAHDKTYEKTCATSEDSDHPAHPRSLIKSSLIACAFYSLQATKWGIN